MAHAYFDPVRADAQNNAAAQSQRSRMHMPVPDFNPDPATVPPISVRNRTPSIRHSPIEIPPDGFIPVADESGGLGLPPPHELSRPPPTPGEGNTPITPTAPLPPRSPVARDYAYSRSRDDLRERDRGEPSSAPRGHGYSRSVADSVASTATSNMSILTPPGNPRASVTRLDVIPEYDQESMRQPSPVIPQNMGVPRTSSRASFQSSRTGRSGALGMNGMYPTPQQQFTEHRQRVADELRV